MTQLQLPMLTVYSGPALVPSDVVAECETYRDAVKRCYMLRKRTRMTNRALAEETGCYAPHIGQYITDSKHQRELPASHIEAFEVACGNRCITQWIAAQANLTILETFIQQRAA